MRMISQWIPCSERLPEKNMSVLASFAHGTVTELLLLMEIFTVYMAHTRQK